jgi:HK97 family phage major capsid protein
MDQEIKTLLEGLRTANDGIKAAHAQMLSEISTLGSASTETKTAVDKLLTSEQKLRDDLNALTLKVEESGTGRGRKEKSRGEIFTESAQFKGSVAAGQLKSGQVRVPSWLKDVTGNAADNVSDGIAQPRRIETFSDPKIELRVRDLLTVLPINQPSVEYVKHTFTNNAAIIFDASPSPTGRREGITKPKSDMTTTRASETAETIAHWIAASKQILQDIPQLRAIIDGEMRYGVKLAEEEELLNGDGTAGHLDGLMNQAASFDTNYLNAESTNLDRLRAGILQARVAKYPVDGFVLNPVDWFNIETLKDSEGRYIIGDPRGMIGKQLWGKPVVESDSIDSGTWLTGAFRMAARLYDLEQAVVETSDSHANFFIENMIAIRAEERLIFVVTRPQAFVTGTFA